ncbi:hypothetical protein K0M31_009517 [Melipona bicolor]|uniref:Uncharacterized protein n=1 Tax=Melipona bicolor TaxID=60889 RepID=A0AA40FNV6_9HYME|nr:hypothetical protein K0M31_009517 [Melipona bicolor]
MVARGLDEEVCQPEGGPGGGLGGIGKWDNSNKKGQRGERENGARRRRRRGGEGRRKKKKKKKKKKKEKEKKKRKKEKKMEQVNVIGLSQPAILLVKQFLSSVAISANINSTPFILPPISFYLTPHARHFSTPLLILLPRPFIAPSSPRCQD